MRELPTDVVVCAGILGAGHVDDYAKVTFVLLWYDCNAACDHT